LAEEKDKPPQRPETLAAQALGWVDERTRAISPPLHVSSTFVRDPDNQYRSGRGYIRADNPSFDQAEALLTAL
jgi:cystathionine gamma-synthase